ncbi:MAG: hydrogenase formation protein HypD [Bacteroidales bacterium]|nr:hydrogenase formation protein HypD [Lentimicrobiaceae bacterium]MDD5695655.1 hydrogenase formation protein HypD [Bacteroidales bacterium]
MKYMDEYRDRRLVDHLVHQIRKVSSTPVNLMEVCGGHTMSIQKFGIPSLLPDTVRLVSGPGCPVCVTSRHFIDKAIAFARLKEVIITTFGDLIRVPGSSTSLEKEKASGADIRIVYSILDAIQIARENPEKKIVFLGIGFETTSPGTAAGMKKVAEMHIPNFFLYSSHKVMPPAMRALIHEGIAIDGFIAPGHVSTITGTGIYDEFPLKYGIGCVVSGFEPVDLLQSVLKLVLQVENKQPGVDIQYTRAVKPQGNQKALQLLRNVFELQDDWWRGLGVLPQSGLRLKPEYQHFDAENEIPVKVEETREEKGCICGDILKGLRQPGECKLFGNPCTPSDPIGACMVSNEGTCHAWYRYNRHG